MNFFKKFLPAIVTVVLILGLGFWLWQNSSFKINNKVSKEVEKVQKNQPNEIKTNVEKDKTENKKDEIKKDEKEFKCEIVKEKIEKHTADYDITVEYPKIIINGIEKKDLNSQQKKVADGDIEEFITSVGDMYVDIPLDKEIKSTLEKTFEESRCNKNVLSIGFSQYSYYRGAAHPNSRFSALNYDLSSEKEINIKDIFLAEKDFNDFASLATQRAKQELLAKAPEYVIDENFTEGTKATVENYNNFVLTDSGLSVSFNAYQIAAYVFGATDIDFTKEEIAKLIKTQYQ